MVFVVNADFVALYLADESLTSKYHTMATLTKTFLRHITVFTIVVLFSNCSKDEGTQPDPQTPIAASQNSRSEEKIYDQIVWDLYDAWGYAFEAHIIDASVVRGRDKKRLTVFVWDDQRMDWSDHDKYDWYLYQDAIHIVHPSFDDAIRGTYARIKVIYN